MGFSPIMECGTCGTVTAPRKPFGIFSAAIQSMVSPLGFLVPPFSQWLPWRGLVLYSPASPPCYMYIYYICISIYNEGTRMQGIFVRKKGYHFACQTRRRCPCQRIKGSSPGFAFNMCGHARHAQGNWKCAPSRLHAYLVRGRCLVSSEHLRNAQKAYTYKMRSETPFGRRPEIQCYLICEV